MSLRGVWSIRSVQIQLLQAKLILTKPTVGKNFGDLIFGLICRYIHQRERERDQKTDTKRERERENESDSELLHRSCDTLRLLPQSVANLETVESRD